MACTLVLEFSNMAEGLQAASPGVIHVNQMSGICNFIFALLGIAKQFL